MGRLLFDEINFGRDLSEEELTKIIKGDSEDSLPALKELLRRGTQQSSKIAEEVLRDKLFPRRMKMTAASYVKTFGTSEQTDLLLDIIYREEIPIGLKNRLIRISGEIGNNETLKKIEKLGDDSNFHFARTLISYRFRLNKYYLDLNHVRPKAFPENVEKINLKKLTKTRVKDIQQLRFDSININSKYKKTIDGVSCEGREYVFNMENSMEGLSSFEELTKRQAIPFEIFKLETCPEMKSLSYYVMTHPSKGDNILINVTNTSGEVCYTGSMTLEKDDLHFKVSSVEHAMISASNFEGSISLDKATINFKQANIGKTISRVKRKVPRVAT